jgi:hypothetical protein
MPGEIGNEDESQVCGFGEHRYRPDQTPQCDADKKTLPMDMGVRPKSTMILNVIRKLHDDRDLDKE